MYKKKDIAAFLKSMQRYYKSDINKKNYNNKFDSSFGKSKNKKISYNKKGDYHD